MPKLSVACYSTASTEITAVRAAKENVQKNESINRPGTSGERCGGKKDYVTSQERDFRPREFAFIPRSALTRWRCEEPLANLRSLPKTPSSLQTPANSFLTDKDHATVPSPSARVSLLCLSTLRERDPLNSLASSRIAIMKLGRRCNTDAITKLGFKWERERAGEFCTSRSNVKCRRTL